MVIGYGEPVLNRYERICFDKKYCTMQGLPQAELICPGHPLLAAIIDLIREKSIDVMKRGSVLIDDSEYSTEAKLLFYIESSVQDGVLNADGSRRTISKNVQFVEIKEDGPASSAGYAPYLDYRAATEDEASVLRTCHLGGLGLASSDTHYISKLVVMKHVLDGGILMVAVECVPMTEHIEKILMSAEHGDKVGFHCGISVRTIKM